MRKLLKTILRLTKSKEHKINFTANKDGWHVLSVSARVRSEKQRGKTKTDDEDLRVEIDGQKFPKIDNPKRYFDSAAAFSGGKLHNSRKTVYFIIYFDAGKHELSLISDEGALVDDASLSVIDDPSRIRINLEEQAEKEERRPWMTFVLVNAGLKSFTIKATAKFRFPDGDDIKIIVDDKIKKNKLSVLRRDWIFAGTLLRKWRNEETVEKTFEENLPVKDLHYLEIWADETPTVHFIELNLDAPEQNQSKKPELQPIIQTYNQGPDGQDYNKYDKDIEKAVKEWNDLFLSQKYPPPEPLDPNLVKALIYIETGMGHHEGTNDPYPDIMQVAHKDNPAVHTLNNDGWIDPATGRVAKESEINAEDTRETVDYHGEANGDKPEQSIHWGVRWLYHKAQGITYSKKRYWRSWNEAVQNYNSEGNVEYEERVYNIYKKGIDPHGNVLWKKSDASGFIKMFMVFIISTLLVLSTTVYVLLDHQSRDVVESSNEHVLGVASQKDEPLHLWEIHEIIQELMIQPMIEYQKPQRHYGAIFKKAATFCQEHENTCALGHVFTPYLDELAKHMQSREQFIEAATVLGIIYAGNFSHSDVDGDGENEIVMIIPDYLNRTYMTLSVIDNISGNFEMIEQRIRRSYFNAPDSIYPMRPLHIMDLTGDEVPEIALFLSGGRWGGHLHVFSYHNGILKQRFQTEDVYAYPEYTFTDQNKNSILEIHLSGEKFDVIPFNIECMACQHIEVEEIFEYNPRKDNFEMTKQSYLGIPGTMHYALIDIAKQGLNHPLLRDWTKDAKDGFAYTLKKLDTEVNNGIFYTVDGMPVLDEGKDEVLLQLKGHLRAEDIVLRPNETQDKSDKQLLYYANSPVYEAQFIKDKEQWNLVHFAEQE